MDLKKLEDELPHQEKVVHEAIKDALAHLRVLNQSDKDFMKYLAAYLRDEENTSILGRHGFELV